MMKLKDIIKLERDFKEIAEIIEDEDYCIKDKYGKFRKFKSVGFGYAVNLFYCAVLFYYDRFNRLDKMAVYKLFLWAMMIRIQRPSLG